MNVTVNVVLGDGFHNAACTLDVDVVKCEVPTKSVVIVFSNKVAYFVS